jgi:hypothetical protein
MIEITLGVKDRKEELTQGGAARSIATSQCWPPETLFTTCVNLFMQSKCGNKYIMVMAM